MNKTKRLSTAVLLSSVLVNTHINILAMDQENIINNFAKLKDGTSNKKEELSEFKRGFISEVTKLVNDSLLGMDKNAEDWYTIDLNDVETIEGIKKLIEDGTISKENSILDYAKLDADTKKTIFEYLDGYFLQVADNEKGYDHYNYHDVMEYLHCLDMSEVVSKLPSPSGEPSGYTPFWSDCLMWVINDLLDLPKGRLEIHHHERYNAQTPYWSLVFVKKDELENDLKHYNNIYTVKVKDVMSLLDHVEEHFHRKLDLEASPLRIVPYKVNGKVVEEPYAYIKKITEFNGEELNEFQQDFFVKLTDVVWKSILKAKDLFDKDLFDEEPYSEAELKSLAAAEDLKSLAAYVYYHNMFPSDYRKTNILNYSLTLSEYFPWTWQSLLNYLHKYLYDVELAYCQGDEKKRRSLMDDDTFDNYLEITKPFRNIDVSALWEKIGSGINRYRPRPCEMLIWVLNDILKMPKGYLIYDEERDEKNPEIDYSTLRFFSANEYTKKILKGKEKETYVLNNFPSTEDLLEHVLKGTSTKDKTWEKELDVDKLSCYQKNFFNELSNLVYELMSKATPEDYSGSEVIRLLKDLKEDPEDDLEGKNILIYKDYIKNENDRKHLLNFLCGKFREIEKEVCAVSIRELGENVKNIDLKIYDIANKMKYGEQDKKEKVVEDLKIIKESLEQLKGSLEKFERTIQGDEAKKIFKDIKDRLEQFKNSKIYSWVKKQDNLKVDDVFKVKSSFDESFRNDDFGITNIDTIREKLLPELNNQIKEGKCFKQVVERLKKHLDSPENYLKFTSDLRKIDVLKKIKDCKTFSYKPKGYQGVNRSDGILEWVLWKVLGLSGNANLYIRNAIIKDMSGKEYNSLMLDFLSSSRFEERKEKLKSMENVNPLFVVKSFKEPMDLLKHLEKIEDINKRSHSPLSVDGYYKDEKTSKFCTIHW